MAPSSKNAGPKDRRKSDKQDRVDKIEDSSSQSSLVVTLKVPAKRLKALFESTPDPSTKEESPAKDSPATSATLQATAPSNADNASDSTPNTPAASGTPAPSSTMGPPAEGPKKKGVKRSAAGANGSSDPLAKVRGKPGPKKKQRLDDGTIDPNRSGGLGASHKLGPKANQGAINAGLRALDRSGKPCRKWAKGNFTLKSFTGVIWEIPRWTAPPKPAPEEPVVEESASASAEGSNKENKENDQVKSDPSNSGGDVEMQSAPPSIPASSPAPIAIPAAS